MITYKDINIREYEESKHTDNGLTLTRLTDDGTGVVKDITQQYPKGAGLVVYLEHYTFQDKGVHVRDTYVLNLASLNKTNKEYQVLTLDASDNAPEIYKGMYDRSTYKKLQEEYPDAPAEWLNILNNAKLIDIL